MSLAQRIVKRLEKLPESIQSEVLDFIDFIDSRKGADSAWKDLSISSAMRGMEDELSPEYTTGDLKEKFQ